MIHRICVSNYRSIRDQVTLDFRVPKTTPDKPWLRHPTARSNLRVPSVIALIGPNGSGKSGWLRALADTIHFAARSYGDEPGSITGFTAFASKETLAKPTRIQVEFDGPWLRSSPEEPRCVYRYTVELLREAPGFSPDTVAYEALHDFPRGRPRRLIERRGDQPVHVAKDMSIRPSDDRLAAVPANASVLSTLARMGVETFSTIVEGLIQVQMNVTAIDPIRLDDETVIHYYRDNPWAREQLSDKLGRFDLGIERMDTQQLKSGIWSLAFSHFGLTAKIPLQGESAGTRHVVHVFPLPKFRARNGRLGIDGRSGQ